MKRKSAWDWIDEYFDTPADTLPLKCGWCGVNPATAPNGECADCATLPGHDYENANVVPVHPVWVDAGQLSGKFKRNGQ